MVNIVVPQRAHGWKLDRFLMDTYATLSYSTIQKALRKKDIRINGKKVNSNTVVQAGDEITLYIPDQILNGTVDPTSPPSALPWLEVVYEDANLLIVNKKPGVSVHEDKLTRKGETLIEKATAYLTAKGEYHPAAGAFAPALCHRLDHYTGGIVIIAKTQPAYAIMLELIKNREIQKFYRCLVKGCPSPSQAELKHYLLKDEKNSQVYILESPKKGALTIITRYRVATPGKAMSLLEVELVTGRTHQIRAHLAHIGHPILGDDKYGDRQFNRQYGAKYQALWAWKVVFNFEEGGPLQYLKGKAFEVKEIRFPAKAMESLKPKSPI